MVGAAAFVAAAAFGADWYGRRHRPEPLPDPAAMSNTELLAEARRLTAEQAAPPAQLGPDTQPIAVVGRHRSGGARPGAVTATNMLRVRVANPGASVDEQLQAGR